MAKRKNIIRISTESVQGEGSFVAFKRPTLDEITALAKATENATQEEQIAYARALVSEYVVDWDWVDDDDNPLPLPQLDPSVVGKLTDTELRAIMTGFSLSEDEKKG